MDDRRAFIEILTDLQYQTQQRETYVGGWGEHQGSWGGQVVDAKVVGGRSTVHLDEGSLEPGKYWIRTALLAGNTYRDSDAQFDRLIYGLVGKPIDYKGGSYFLNEKVPGKGTINRRYYASRYYPFLVLPLEDGDTPPIEGVTDSSRSSLTVGVFSFDVPPGWEVVSGADQQAAKRQVEASVQEMIKRFESSGEHPQGLLGIESFKAIRMPDQSGWAIAYTVRIPPQTDYLATVEQDQAEKIAWGRREGIVSRVISHGRVAIGGEEAIKVDTEMQSGVRTIGIYHWSPEEPGLVGVISVVVSPGRYGAIEDSLEAVLSSLQIGAL